MTANRATIVVKVGGKEVARRQVRVEDGATVVLELQPGDVADAVGQAVRAMRTRAQFRATGDGT